MVVDDDGEPVTDEFIFDDRDEAVKLRNNTEGWKRFRVVECGYRVFADEPEVVDDPKAGPK